MGFTIITRKIEIFIEESDIEKRKEHYKCLRDYSMYSRNLANDIMNLKQSLRFVKSVSDVSLSDYIDGSERNLGYKVFTSKYKNLLPSYIRSSINKKVSNDFKNSIKDILRGDTTIISYKKDFPIFLRSNDIRKFGQDGFLFNSIQFKFNFGRDRSDNRSIVNGVISGNYKMCDSFLKFKDNKLFLFMSCKIPLNKQKLDDDRVMGVDLGINFPAYISVNNTDFERSIGTREEFLNQRLGIQKQKTELQRSLVSTRGGRGRGKKLSKLESVREKERNFVKTLNHKYSKQIVESAIVERCSIINMEDLLSISKGDKNQFILRNWSYYELQSMVKYKAEKNGIKVNLVDPRYTSQKCHKCGNVHKDNRVSQSEFLCGVCGYSGNADYNASKNISLIK